MREVRSTLLIMIISLLSLLSVLRLDNALTKLKLRNAEQVSQMCTVTDKHDGLTSLPCGKTAVVLPNRYITVSFEDDSYKVTAPKDFFDNVSVGDTVPISVYRSSGSVLRVELDTADTASK